MKKLYEIKTTNSINLELVGDTRWSRVDFLDRISNKIAKEVVEGGEPWKTHLGNSRDMVEDKIVTQYYTVIARNESGFGRSIEIFWDSELIKDFGLIEEGE